MKLIEPTMEYERQLRAYRAEFLASGESMDGGGSLIRYENPRDWLDVTERFKRRETTPPDMVPASQYLYVREEDDKIVGVIQIRHDLNEYLARFGGHIGYSVAPSERRKGYATGMLRLVLPICRDLGITRALITCYRENEGSRHTILKCGGVYESSVVEPESGRTLERYWIDLSRLEK